MKRYIWLKGRLHAESLKRRHGVREGGDLHRWSLVGHSLPECLRLLQPLTSKTPNPKLITEWLLWNQDGGNREHVPQMEDRSLFPRVTFHLYATITCFALLRQGALLGEGQQQERIVFFSSVMLLKWTYTSLFALGLKMERFGSIIPSVTNVKCFLKASRLAVAGDKKLGLTRMPRPWFFHNSSHMSR